MRTGCDRARSARARQALSPNSGSLKGGGANLPPEGGKAYGNTARGPCGPLGHQPAARCLLTPRPFTAPTIYPAPPFLGDLGSESQVEPRSPAPPTSLA